MIDKEKFLKYYIEDNMTQTECAKIFNCSKSAIVKYCKENNIVKGKGKGKNNTPAITDIEFFKKYYIDENHTQLECAEYFKCTRETIVKFCRENNIKKEREQINKNISTYRRIDIDIKDIENEYLDNDLSMIDCAEKLGVSLATIRRRLEENDIKKDHKMTKYSAEKAKQTFLKNYGVDSPMKLDYIKEKVNKTCLERYGVPWNCLTTQAQEANGSTKHSKTNDSFAHFLEINKIDFTREEKINGRSYDFKIGDKLIEINPTATHNVAWSPFGDHQPDIEKNYHKKKLQLAIDNNYRCMMIWDWDNQNAIKNYLIGHKETIYARQCDIKIITEEEAKQLLEQYHFQGYARAKLNYGLFYENQLVSVMSFGSPRYNKNYQWEIIRYCSTKNIIGGAERLFKHFIQENKVESVVSYCDLSKFSGDTYKKLGFELIRTSQPSLHWFRKKDKKHFTDNLIRAYGVSRVVNHCEPEEDKIAIEAATNDNYQLMLLNEFLPVYDCGQQTWGWTK